MDDAEEEVDADYGDRWRWGLRRFGDVDDDCDDGGPGSEWVSCPLGTDCEDCGTRTTTLGAPSAPWSAAPVGNLEGPKTADNS